MAIEAGQVITFYSYKGGTGRSMALANTACLLAQNKEKAKRVLMIDWDLEAPGLHQFFAGHLTKISRESAPCDIDSSPGLIDLFWELKDKIYDSYEEGETQTEKEAHSLLSRTHLNKYIVETDIPSLYLLKAGCFDENYSSRVNTFQWENLFDRSPWLIRSFATLLAEKFNYVLVDSRTGLTDISGICTALMPAKLVVVFIPNRQSLTGVLDLIQKSTNYRRQSDDLRPLIVFPLASRIEENEQELREAWRFGSEEKKIEGYQPQFQNIFEEVYGFPQCDLSIYFNQVQLPHRSFYSYGEEIAVLTEQESDLSSLTYRYEKFCQFLVEYEAPWEGAQQEKKLSLSSLLTQYRAPALPSPFLPRWEDQCGVRKLIFDSIGEQTATRSAIHGIGGVGKSVLAATLAEDEEIRSAFPDGIVWISLGQEPKLVSHQLQIAGVLSEDPLTFDNIDQGKATLRELLKNKRLLFILDNVWQLEHIDAFDVLGAHCHILVTTRDSGLVRSLEATGHCLGLLSDAQARELLAKSANLPLEDLPSQAEEVVQLCGNLPLALAMVGTTIRENPDGWDRVLHRLQKADLEKIAHRLPSYPYRNIAQALEASFSPLSSDHKQRYLDFAVFQEDTPIPDTVLQTFWQSEGLDQYDILDIVEELLNRSLLQRDEHGHLILHPLLYGYIRNRVGSERLSPLHERLLTAYARHCSDGWSTGPQDGYFFEHLAYHLVQAGRRDELQELLLNFDWLQTKLNATSADALTKDFNYLKNNKELVQVQEAIRLSQHILAKDKTQLANQLLGRLLSSRSAMVQKLLEQAKQRKVAVWFCPTEAHLATPDGPLLQTLSGHTRPVTAVALTPNGQRAISASRDHTLKVWDLEQGQQPSTLAGHSEPVTAVVVTPDGQHFISASEDKTLKVWDLEQGQEIRSLTGHSRRVNAVAVTPDGRQIISASEDGSIKVWDLEQGQELYPLHGHGGAITAVVVTPDSRHLISASADTTLKVWDLAQKRELHTLTAHSGPATAVVVTPDSHHLISASADATLKIWDLEQGKALYTLGTHSMAVTALAVTPDSHHLISASADATLKIWDLKSERELYTLAGHTAQIAGIAVTPDGQQIISASWDTTLKVWTLKRGPTSYPSAAHTAPVRAVAVTADGQQAVSVSDDAILKVWDLSSHQEVQTLTDSVDSVNGTVVTPDEQKEISISEETSLKVRDLISRQELHTLTGHMGRINRVLVTHNGQQAISASQDTTMIVWDLEQGREVRTLRGHAGAVNAIALTPDGKRVISASDDTTLKVWNLSSGLVENTLVGHAQSVNGIDITPDGQYAISASRDATLRAWDLIKKEIIASFIGDSPFLSCALGPDGETLIAGDQSGQVHFFHLKRDANREELEP